MWQIMIRCSDLHHHSMMISVNGTYPMWHIWRIGLAQGIFYDATLFTQALCWTKVHTCVFTKNMFYNSPGSYQVVPNCGPKLPVMPSSAPTTEQPSATPTLQPLAEPSARSLFGFRWIRRIRVGKIICQISF